MQYFYYSSFVVFLLQVQIFSNFDALEASDMRLQVGAVGFEMDT